MKLTATLLLDLRKEDQPLRAATMSLNSAPDGCRVVLRVREDQQPDVLSFALVRDHLARLGEVDVQCASTDAIRLWHAALRGTDPWWEAS